MMLERQNKEIKAKLEEVENSNRAKAKAAIGRINLFVENKLIDSRLSGILFFGYYTCIAY